MFYGSGVSLAERGSGFSVYSGRMDWYESTGNCCSTFGPQRCVSPKTDPEPAFFVCVTSRVGRTLARLPVILFQLALVPLFLGEEHYRRSTGGARLVTSPEYLITYGDAQRDQVFGAGHQPTAVRVH